ncbi:aquaporin [Micrococcaceae bacterium Sec5.7]
MTTPESAYHANEPHANEPHAVEPHAVEPHAGGDAAFRPGLVSRLSAEAFGALFLVIAGLGVPLFTIPQSNPLSASLAAGLAVTAAMLAFAYISGGHFNPAITVGNAIAGRIRLSEAAAYIGAQLVGAAVGALTLFGILRTVPKIEDTRAAFDTVTAGFGEHSIIQAPLAGVLLVEVIGAALLVAVFLGTTARRNVHKAAAPFAVGLTFAVLLQLGQAIGNTPFNPARATASALFSNIWSLQELWLFWVAPLVGAAIAGLVFRGFSESPAVAPLGTEPTDDNDFDAPDDDAPAAAASDAGDRADVADDHEFSNDAVSHDGASHDGASREGVSGGGVTRDEARDFFDEKRGQ